MNFINSLINTATGQYKEGEETAPRFDSLVHAIKAIDSQEPQKVRAGYFPVHVSTAIRFCARQHYLMEKSEDIFTSPVTSADRVLWAIGKAIEGHNRESLIKAFDPYNVYGVWRCRCEAMEMVGLGRNPNGRRCNICGTSLITKYDELPLKYEDLMIGNPDLLLRMGPDRKLTVVEFKSIKPEEFKTLKAPANVYHKLQPYFYIKLLEKNKERFDLSAVEINSDYFYIHYTSKGYAFESFGQDVHKEFKIQVNDLGPAVRDEFDNVVNQLRKLKAGGGIPERVICDSVTCKKAKECPVRNICFSL